MTSTLQGTTGADTIFASTASSTIAFGGAGDDRLVQQFLTSTLYGGAGNDLIQIDVPGGAITQVFGGQGNDTIYLTGGATTTTVYASVGGNNDGNDLFEYNGGAGLDIQGSLLGGAGNDTLLMSGAELVAGAFYGNAGADNFRTEGGVYRGSFIGLGADNDSATFALANGSVLENSTLNGGEGKDTLQISGLGLVISGSVRLGMGGGADIISAHLQTATLSGDLLFAGDSGTDTITLELEGLRAVAAGGSLSIFGDTGLDVTAAHNDLIVFDLSETAISITGTLSGGGGADTLLVTSTLTSLSGYVGQILGGYGNDIIKVDGLAFRSTIDGGEGADSISYNFGGTTAQVVSSYANWSTLVGGAGNDTFVNTAFNTASNGSGGGVTGLGWNLHGFATGDVIRLIANTRVNAEANIANSAFITSTITSLLSAAIGDAWNGDNEAHNTIALFQEGNDVILQIAQGTLNRSLASGLGIGVIRFMNNTTLLAGASGGGALSNVGISITQTLNGMTITFT